MQSNQHKRLARKLLRRFEPTWTGQAVNPTSAALPTALNTAEANPLPVTTSQQPQLPATSLALPTSIIEPVVPTSTIPPATQPQLTTSSLQPLTTSQAVLTTESTSSIALVTSSTESISSTTPLTTSAAVISTTATPVRTTAAAPATTSRAAAPAVPSSQSPSLVRTSSLFTDSAGVIVETIVVVPAPTPTVSATETATPKSTGNAGTIVGAVAGGFVALICLIAFVSWIVRQHNKRNRGNHDDFDKQSYLRNSMMIPDEPDRPVRGTQAALALARSNTAVGPRPPTMIERKNTYYTHGQPSPSFAPGQVISFDPGQIVSAPGTAGEPAYPSPVAFAAYTPPEQHHQSELVRHPSGAQLLNRAPTNGGMYDHSYSPSPVSYPDSYGMHSPDSYGHDGYTYPMHPGVVDHRNMVQSVTAFQAEQYAEISRQLEADADYGHESFHPISPGPGPASPVVRSTSVGSPIKESPSEEQHLPNPFDDRIASNQRIDSMPPALPVIEGLSRTGTPIDPNPQYAHWSYDGKAQGEGNRLSVAGVQMPEPPTPPAMAVIREDQPAHAPASAPTLNVAPQPAKRPVSVFDADDAYGGM